MTSSIGSVSMPPMRPIFPGGQPATADIVGRDDDITRLWNRLLAGSCLLNEPRRIGKSSLLVRAAAGRKPPNWELIHTSVQGISSTAEFVAHALHAIQGQRSLPDRLRAVARGFLADSDVTLGAGGTGITLRGALRQTPLQTLEIAGSLLLGAGCQFDEPARVALADQTDGIPYLLHLVAGWARDHGPVLVTAADVPPLFTAAVGDLDASHQSTHLLSRLGDYYGEDTRAAESILDQLAVAPASRAELAVATRVEGTSFDEEMLRDLLGLLERDHYLVADSAGRRAWRYDALRRIWLQRRV